MFVRGANNDDKFSNDPSPVCCDVADDVVGVDAFGFAFEAEDQPVAQGGNGHGAHILARDMKAPFNSARARLAARIACAPRGEAP